MYGVERVIDRRQADIMAERKRRRDELVAEIDKRRSDRRLNVKIKLLPGAELPEYARPGDSGFDLVAQEDYVIEPGQTVKIRTGICVELPPGYEVQVRPRSGISERTKLRVANSPGTGDSSYRGEICVLIDNIAVRSTYKCGHYECLDGSKLPTPMRVVYGYGDAESRVHEEVSYDEYLIRKGDRIAQAVIAPVYRASFEVVAELSETERGAGGFGHTGT